MIPRMGMVWQHEQPDRAVPFVHKGQRCWAGNPGRIGHAECALLTGGMRIRPQSNQDQSGIAPYGPDDVASYL